jgi:hypothetical protein
MELLYDDTKMQTDKKTVENAVIIKVKRLTK